MKDNDNFYIAPANKRSSQDKREWPPYLREYYAFYHCLANFWIAPKGIGHGWHPHHRQCDINRGRFTGLQDYIDAYLQKIYGFFCLNQKNNFQCKYDPDNKHRTFYEQFGDEQKGWDTFINVFCLEPYLSSTVKNEFIRLSIMNAETFCVIVKTLIQQRAVLLAEKYQTELSILFSSLKTVDQ
ncbi:hypothetical protein [Bifidobacterium bohemicum]|uniref:hypothetical protein n=1 Tax=Bifidobacterium bohemicum TaxID=638617 RepID=UPI0011773B03|nr:hypothetical protein [Bifidobacterium bohemicum]